jgi:hypothetical protein
MASRVLMLGWLLSVQRLTVRHQISDGQREAFKGYVSGDQKCLPLVGASDAL